MQEPWINSGISADSNPKISLFIVKKLNPELSVLRQSSRRLYNRAKNSNNPADWDLFKISKNAYKNQPHMPKERPDGNFARTSSPQMMQLGLEKLC